jgi:hypothetical protein
MFRGRVIALIGAAAISCGTRVPAPTPPPPKIVLWAWDRAEDLRFLRPGEAEVAALMRTLYLRNGAVDHWYRKLPLLMPESMQPIPVTRLESDGSELPPAQDVAGFLWWRAPAKIQIDFDAKASQLAWYGELIRALRGHRRSISITALASWCLDAPWFRGTVDEAVPMLFRMGPGRNEFLDRLYKQQAFTEGCREAIGISTDEPLRWQPGAKTVYVFHPERWTREAFDEVRLRLSQSAD